MVLYFSPVLPGKEPAPIQSPIASYRRGRLGDETLRRGQKFCNSFPEIIVYSYVAVRPKFLRRKEVILFKRALIVLVVAGFFGFLGYRVYQAVQATDAVDAPRGGRGPGRGGSGMAMLVETAVVQPQYFDRSLEVLGELQAQATVEVMSRISGRLEQVIPYRGDRVEKGQLMAVLEDADLQQQILRQDAAIAVAKAALSREEATVDNLELQLRRFEKLYDEELVSLQDLEDMQSRVRVAVSQKNLAAAQVDQAQAALRELNVQQEQTRIYASLSGFVGQRFLEPGAVVSPSTPIVSILNLDRVKTIVAVPETALDAISLGLASSITIDAFPDRQYKGSITRISPFLDPETRSADVEIEIPNPEHLLKPGMFARASIDVNVRTQSMAIPRAALLTRGDQQGVFLLQDGSRVQFRTVEIGRIQGENVEILRGVDPGTIIVSGGAQNLNDGDTVRISSGDPNLD